MALTTLGCKVNQAETEEIAVGFAHAGFARVEFGERADVYIINTCTVTHIADRKSRQLIRQARRLNDKALVVATGCYAEVDPVAVSSTGGVDLVIGNGDKERLVDLVLGSCTGLPRGMAVTNGSGSRTRAFVKVQSGCDNHCTYCIVPRARGPQRSELEDNVLRAVAQRTAEGYKEVVLTGVHVGAYGRDHAEPTAVDLAGLLRSILEHTAIERVRLSSLEPEDTSERLMALWAEFPARLCRHLHLPLQSGSESVLRRMGRHYRASDFARLVRKAREAIPGVAITTDLMVGFPGESEAEHAESRDFVRSLAFAGMHVFKYSPRPGTPAARLPARVPAPVAKSRSDTMMSLARQSARTFREQLIGQRLPVLFEERYVDANGVAHWSGLTDNYVRVHVPSSLDLANRILETSLVRETDDGILGDVLA